MRAKIKITLTISVVVEVTTEWNRSARQSVIVDAEIDDRNRVTPRTVYEVMNRAQFNYMDIESLHSLHKLFDKSCEGYQDKPLTSLPDEEMRGFPMHPTTWSKWVMRMHGGFLTLPVRPFLEALKGLEQDVLLEPVLCRVPTVYIWNVSPEKDVLDTVSARAGHSMKSPQAERLEEGCLRLRWQR